MNLRSVLQASALILVGTLCFSAEMPQASGQGILRRLRSRLQAPVPQSQYRPQTVAPNNSPPNRDTNQATRGSKQTQSYRIDPRTGRVIIVQTPTQSTAGGRPIQVQPSTGKKGAAKEQPATSQPTLGLRVVQATSGTPGLDVLKIQSHSLADEAGIQVGDRIVSFNGQPTLSVDELARTLQSTTVGQTGVLRIVRRNRVGDVRVPLVATPPSKQKSTAAAARSNVAKSVADPKGTTENDNGVHLGINIEDRTGVRGVIITSVDPDSPAAAAGFQTGDRLVSVDGRMVIDSDALSQVLSSRSKQTPMSVQLVRENRVRASTVSFAAVAPTANAAESIQSSAKVPPKSPTSNDAPAGSMFEGIGSVVGSLFGGRNADTAKAPAQDDQAKGKAAASESDLSASPAPPTTTSGKQTPQGQAPLSVGKSILVPSEPMTTNPVVQSPPAKAASPVAPVGNVEDEMAFGDDEPIGQAIFAQPLAADAIPERKLDLKRAIPSSDPPSAAKISPPAQPEKMELNPPKPLPSAEAEKIKALELELKRLRKLLDEK